MRARILALADDRWASAFVALLAGALAAGLALVAPKYALASVALAVALVGLAVALRRLEIGVIGLVLAASLDVTGRIASVGGANITLYQVGAFAVAIIAVWGIARERSPLPETPMDVPVAAFLLLSAASIAPAPAVNTALVAFVSLASSALLLYLVVLAARTPDAAERIIWATLGAAAVLGLMALLERKHIFSVQPPLNIWGYGIRSRVTFKDPNIFGAFLATALCLATPLWIRLKGVGRKTIAGAAMAAALLGLGLTFSRGALVAFLLGMLVVLVFARVPFSWKVAALLAGLIGMFVVGVKLVDPALIQSKIINITTNHSAVQRIYLARSSWEMSRDHPMGVGIGNYAQVSPLYRQAEVNLKLVESHTAYLTVLAEVGILGLIAFAWLIVRFLGPVFAAVRRAPDDVHTIALAALAAGVGLLAQALTYSLEASKFLWLTFGLGMAAVTMYRANSKGSDDGAV